MINKKRVIFNIISFAIIILTLVAAVNEYLYYKNETEVYRQMYGDGIYVTELLMVDVIISSLFLLIIEISICFNLRYFIINNNKTTIKTILNILILMLAVALYVIGYILENVEFSVFLVFLSLLLVLWILYIFVRKKY